MRKYLFLILMMAFIPGFMSGKSAVGDPAETAWMNNGKVKTVIYLFHPTLRCQGCLSAEEVTKRMLRETYAISMARKELVFKSIDFQKKANRKLCKEFGISTKALWVVHGNDRFDLSETGFQYAVKSPEKLVSVYNSILERYLK